MAFFSGKRQKVRIAGGVHRVETSNVEDTCEELETTNSESATDGTDTFYESEDTGIAMTEFTTEGQLDVGAGPLVVMRPGRLVPNVYFYPAGLAGPFYYWAFFRVIQCTTGAEVKGKIPFKMRGKGNGIFIRPAS